LALMAKPLPLGTAIELQDENGGRPRMGCPLPFLWDSTIKDTNCGAAISRISPTANSRAPWTAIAPRLAVQDA